MLADTKASSGFAVDDIAQVVAAMKELVPTDDLLFLMDLSIEPVLTAQRS